MGPRRGVGVGAVGIETEVGAEVWGRVGAKLEAGVVEPEVGVAAWSARGSRFGGSQSMKTFSGPRT